ncbi:hypothetical protein GRI97_08285 [Altererythrobacter xixiisoli]|uniref:Uncharacterized protein n=1 Tax=Croceibacterium xixiisoli TaxID=1476466 RepID=A0A6I4TS64_9SPHN|nr:hypothetical protein [Croceibacterium xixiisoli]MXO98985.1 hypothetical protein [Croceibacterium xixiisoli]
MIEQSQILAAIGTEVVPLWRFQNRLDDLRAMWRRGLIEWGKHPSTGLEMVRLTPKGRRSIGLPPPGFRFATMTIPEVANDD